MTRVIVYLDEIEGAALCELARREYRDPRAQAALLIRRALESAGLLPSAGNERSLQPAALAGGG